MRISLKLPESSGLLNVLLGNPLEISHIPWLRFKLAVVGQMKPNYEGLRLGIRCGVETFSLFLGAQVLE